MRIRGPCCRQTHKSQRDKFGHQTEKLRAKMHHYGIRESPDQLFSNIQYHAITCIAQRIHFKNLQNLCFRG